LQQAAAQDYARAWYQLGRLYAAKADDTTDPKVYIESYTHAADLGYDRAQYRIGRLHDQGIGLEQDPFKAHEWYKKSARQGFVKAQYALAINYAKGKGVSRDYMKSYAWFYIASKNHDVPSIRKALHKVADKLTVAGIIGAKSLAFKWQSQYKTLVKSEE